MNGKPKKNDQGEVLASRSDMNIGREVDYIVGRARSGEARFVSLGPLVFFSTPGGDAWMLEPQDGLALRLACEGSPLPVRIEETDDGWAVAWEQQFHIENDVFLVTDQAGQILSFGDYPITSILDVIRRATSCP
jgi:hypothetical protein